ncbi:MAG: gamma-glutamylcyclotransferase [Pseudomonadota bacterium]
MVNRRIFGFGSLVTKGTHDYDWIGTCRLAGYRRVWVPSNTWDISFLSVELDPISTIDGAVLEIRDKDWPSLLEREKGYDVHHLDSSRIDPQFNAVSLFVGRPDAIDPERARPFLKSYLDTVITGFVDSFGVDRARGFFTSTAGWENGVKEDRSAPEYPRAVALRADIKTLVDEELEKLGI